MEWGLRKPRHKVERAWANTYTPMHLDSPSTKNPVAHSRAFAACSVSGDPNLPERYCCWSCRKQTAGGEIKGLWPTMLAFTWHWHLTHPSAVQSEWTRLAREFLGIDLNESPLPRAQAALSAIPRLMLDKTEGRKPLIYGSPFSCFVQSCDTQGSSKHEDKEPLPSSTSSSSLPTSSPRPGTGFRG